MPSERAAHWASADLPAEYDTGRCYAKSIRRVFLDAVNPHSLVLLLSNADHTWRVGVVITKMALAA